MELVNPIFFPSIYFSCILFAQNEKSKNDHVYKAKVYYSNNLKSARYSLEVTDSAGDTYWQKFRAGKSRLLMPYRLIKYLKLYWLSMAAVESVLRLVPEVA